MEFNKFGAGKTNRLPAKHRLPTAVFPAGIISLSFTAVPLSRATKASLRAANNGEPRGAQVPVAVNGFPLPVH